MAATATRCPFCHTSFRVTEAQLATAHGMVRCGACLEVFNAEENLVALAAPEPVDNSLPETEDKTATPVETTSINPESEEAVDDNLLFDDENGIDSAEEAEATEEEPPQVFKFVSADEELAEQNEPEPVQPTDTESATETNDDKPKTGDKIFFYSATSKTVTPETEDTPEDQAGRAATEHSSLTPHPRQTEPERPETIPTEPESSRPEPAEPELPAIEVIEHSTPSTEASNPTATKEPTETTATAGSIGEETSKLSEIEQTDTKDEHLSAKRDDFGDFVELVRQSKRQIQINRHQVMWTVLSLLAGLALFAQVIHANFDQLAQSSYRPQLQSLCNVINWATNPENCILPPPENLEQIASLGLNVLTHPDYTDSLLIDAVIINRANFEQPFPIIEFAFSNQRGNKVALRRFSPEEYLAGELKNAKMMPIGQSVRFRLSVIDPGSTAVNYEMNFLPNHPGQ